MFGEIVNYINTAYQSNWYLLIYLLALLCLFFTDAKWRKLIVYPSLILTFIIINPIGYRLVWKNLEGDTYWRLFWMIPVLPVIGCAVISLLMRVKRLPIRIAMSVLCAFLLIMGGNFIYQTESGSFYKAQNQYKISEEAVLVTDLLLRQNEEVYAIIDIPLSYEIREYSASVHQMYGRNLIGNFMDYHDENDEQLYEMLHREIIDFAWIGRYMENLDYQYLIFHLPDEDENMYEAAGFEKLDEIGAYTVLKYDGLD